MVSAVTGTRKEAPREATYAYNVMLRRVLPTIVAVEKPVGITYYEGVFVALGTQRAMRMLNVVICGVPLSTIFFPHDLTNGTIFENSY